MTRKLNTPIETGALDALGPYQDLQLITRNDPIRRLLTIEISYGNTIDGEWAPGIPPTNATTHVVLREDEYDTFIADNKQVAKSMEKAIFDLLDLDGKVPPGTDKP